jgi:hypothetical protein
MGVFALLGSIWSSPCIDGAVFDSEAWWGGGGVRRLCTNCAVWMGLHVNPHFIACATQVLLLCACQSLGMNSSIEHMPYLALLSVPQQLCGSCGLSCS